VKRRALPGLGLSLGLSITHLSLLVLVPMAAVVLHGLQIGPVELWRLVTAPRVMAALGLSFGAALLAAAIDTVLGLLIAWVLVRYRFVGRTLLDVVVDIPFALPTAVAGIALATIYAQTGLLGEPLAALGIQAAYSRTGVVLALVFVGLPFTVRTIQPVLETFDPALEHAAALLGASPRQVFWRVILPALGPAALTGFTLAFARALGEYGSVAFISGNLQMRTEIGPTVIMSKVEQHDLAGATALALAMLVLSMGLLLVLETVLVRQRRGAHP